MRILNFKNHRFGILLFIVCIVITIVAVTNSIKTNNNLKKLEADLEVAQVDLNNLLLPENQSSEYKSILLKHIEQLNQKQKEISELAVSLTNEQDETNSLYQSYTNLFHINMLLQVEKISHENTIKHYNIIIDNSKKIKDYLSYSINSFIDLNKTIKNTTEDIRYRNDVLKLTLRNLGIKSNFKPEIENMPIFEYDKFRKLELIEFTEIPSPYIPLYKNLQNQIIIETNNIVTDSIGITLKDKDQISVIKARIVILDNFIINLRHYLNNLEFKNVLLNEKIEELTESNNALTRTNEELVVKRKHLDNRIEINNSELDSLATKNRIYISKYTDLQKELEKELKTQLNLLKEIGEARLKNEQAQNN